MFVVKSNFTPFSARKQSVDDSMFVPHPPKVHPPVPKINIKGEINDENVGNVPRAPRTPANKSARAANPRFAGRGGPCSARPTTAVNPIVPNGPISPAEARAKYASILNSHELKEIDEFPEIYFLGQASKKIRPNTSTATNYGYDDSQHHYKAQIGDHIAYRYEIRAVLGKGAFGQVLRCFDHKTKKQVALKLIVNTKLMHEQGRIECAIVQHLNGNDNGSNYIIQGIDFLVFRKHICAAFEILGQNLYEYSRAMRFRPIASRQMKPIALQMISGLNFCHVNNVVHCDMKPENVLLTPGGFNSIRIIDFGSSCFIGHQRYEYIQSRYYRAPEVIMGLPYGPPMDVWSYACIVIEMMIGRPIFPGDDENEQMDMLVEVLGMPPKEMIDKCSRKKEFFTIDGRLLPSKKSKKRRRAGSKTLLQATQIPDPMCIDLMLKCLTWDPKKRITAGEAMNHPWFTAKEVHTSIRSSYQLPDLHFR